MHSRLNDIKNRTKQIANKYRKVKASKPEDLPNGTISPKNKIISEDILGKF